MNLVWFRDISKRDADLVGEKASYLAELHNNEYPVPPGFIITHSAFLKFLQETNLLNTITFLIQNSNLEDKSKLYETSSKIQELILNSKFPDNLLNEILEAYENLDINLQSFKLASSSALNIIKASHEQPFISIRLSPDSKIEGLSFLNINGTQNIINIIKKCYAYLYTPEILYKTKGHIKSSIIIQRMIDANKSGIIETFQDEIKVKACYGLNESKVIQFDNYVVSRNSFELNSKQINRQDFCILKDINLGKSVKRTLFEEEATSQKLEDEEIRRLAKISSLIEEIFDSFIKIEFAIEQGKLFFLQVNPLEHIKQIKQRDISNLETVTQLRIYLTDEIKDEYIKNCDGIGLLSCDPKSLTKISPLLENKSAWFLSINPEQDIQYIKQCHDSGFNNIGIILPNITSVEQIRNAKHIIKTHDLEPLEEIEFGIIIDSPQNVQLIEQIASEYIDFISIDLDNLSKLTLGNENISTIRIDPAVLRQLRYVINTCKDNNIEVCVHGSIVNRPDLAEFLIRLGADSLIINPSNIVDLRKTVEKAERKMLLDVARKTTS